MKKFDMSIFPTYEEMWENANEMHQEDFEEWMEGFETNT